MADWELIYGGDRIAGPLSFEQVEVLSNNILSALVAGGAVAWFDFDFPMGDGIGKHRMMLSQGVPIHFKQME
jgi:hypothetical protein